MGPRPDGRGKPKPSALRQAADGVNGAAARRPRKDRPAPDVASQERASMGPRPDGRGKRRAGGYAVLGSLRQWGRGQTAAERSRPPLNTGSVCCVNGAAARRPRKDLACRLARLAACASMGPRPDGRGKPARRGRGWAALGRQWGRGQTAAESLAARQNPSGRLPASMGPRPDGRGKRQRRIRPAYMAVASMGPRPDGRGKPVPAPAAPPPLSVNGAAARRPRKASIPKTRRTFEFERQWGRGQTAAESCRRGRRRRLAERVNGAAARRPRKGRLGSRCAPSGCCVNGAAARRPRKGASRTGKARQVLGASMGPRPDGRGKHRGRA